MTLRSARVRSSLLAWYARNARDLPWRTTRDPYAVWVSEVMLQQTRVETVVRYYPRFLERFPTLDALARAEEDDVLAAWSGLGYYRRARALRLGARAVAERHGGTIPGDPASLRELPGIGRYTAGAIASIAFGRPEPVLDGNVRRVLSRLLGPDGDDGDRPVSDRDLWALAALLVDGPDPGDFNQAMMELGATLCAPRSPRCDACPVRDACAGRASGDPLRWPRASPRTAPTDVRVVAGALRRGSRVLLERPDDDSPFRGRWDLPAAEADGEPDGGRSLASAMQARHGIVVHASPVAATVTHGIVHRRLRIDVHPGRVTRGRVAGSERLRWLDPRDLDRVPVSGATRKILRALDWLSEC